MTEDKDFVDDLLDEWKRKQKEDAIPEEGIQEDAMPEEGIQEGEIPEGWIQEGEIPEEGIHKGELPSDLTEETTGEIPEITTPSVMMEKPADVVMSQMIGNMGKGYFANLETAEVLENLIAKHKYINRIRMEKEKARKEEEKKRKNDDDANIKFL